jgi:hypothetical protein
LVTRREGAMSTQSQCPAPHAGESCADCTVRLVSVCAALPPDELFALEDLAHQVTIPAKQTIFLQGEDAGRTPPDRGFCPARGLPGDCHG